MELVNIILLSFRTRIAHQFINHPALNNHLLQQVKDANKDRQRGPLKIKYAAMAESPFRFFRGSCPLFYQELSDHYPFDTSPAVWACGDLHIENFGTYKGNNRLVYFDMNDFDEALLAPLLWEICRLTTSVQLAADAAGFSKKEKGSLVNTLLSSYIHTLGKGKPLVIERETARGLVKKMIGRLADRKEMELVKKRTSKSNPDKLLKSDRLLAMDRQEKNDLLYSFNSWLAENTGQQLQAIDAGFRIAGTGSIGVKRYVLLLAHSSNPQKRLLADVKEARPSGPAAHASLAQPAWTNEAARIIAIQEMMEHVSPAFLSSFQHRQTWYVVKELQPTGDKVTLFQTTADLSGTEKYLADLGMLVASAQLRSSGRRQSATADELAQFAGNTGWVEPLVQWSVSYAEQVKQEYAIYRSAWKEGFFDKE